MGRITGLEPGKRQPKRVNLSLDGSYAFSLDAEVVVREGLRTGQDLTGEKIAELRGADSIHRCLDAANVLLGYRPRAEAELADRLTRRGFDPAVIAAVLERLKENGLVDDMAFARFWQENRSSFSPRSSLLTGQELRRKGIGQEVIDAVTGEADDYESAYRAAQGKTRRIPVGDYNLFRRRLGDFLRRRGFSYEVIKPVVERIWKECGSGSC